MTEHTIYLAAFAGSAQGMNTTLVDYDNRTAPDPRNVAAFALGVHLGVRFSKTNEGVLLSVGKLKEAIDGLMREGERK